MSDNVNPASQSAKPVDAPYLCSACGKPANDIMCTLLNGLYVFWHGGAGCKGIISVQLAQPPAQAQPRVAVPGGGRLII